MSLVPRKPHIQDEFTDRLISTSRKTQLRRLRDGLCEKCRQPRCEASKTLCLKHWQVLITAQEQRKDAKHQQRINRYWDRRRALETLTLNEVERRKSLTIPLPRIDKLRY